MGGIQVKTLRLHLRPHRYPPTQTRRGTMSITEEQRIRWRGIVEGYAGCMIPEYIHWQLRLIKITKRTYVFKNGDITIRIPKKTMLARLRENGQIPPYESEATP